MKRDVVQFTSKDIILVKWNDKRGFLIASDYTGGNKTASFPRWDKKEKNHIPVTAATIILNYNKNMGGVDVLDQQMEHYRTYQKIKKWTVKVIICLILIVSINKIETLFKIGAYYRRG